MAQHVIALISKPDGLSSVPRTYAVERANQFLQVVFWQPHVPPGLSCGAITQLEKNVRIMDKEFNISNAIIFSLLQVNLYKLTYSKL